MFWKEINQHPTVRPALEAWHAARRRAEETKLDERCGTEARRAARLAATEAERAYDTAVGTLLSGEGSDR